jgi:GNAT superfamily N-acetyltransferase
MSIQFRSYSGPALEPHLDSLGQLRITVFREFPYLYEGTLDHERHYLSTYLDSPRSLVVLAYDGAQVIGATTCVPLIDEIPEFQKPFLDQNIDPQPICYFGESILLPAYRGRGIGKTFFHARETHARSLPGIHMATFCAVDRPRDHPLRPPDYRPLDSFWQARGFQKQPHLTCSLVWKEIGEQNETPKRLTYWTKTLPPTQP